VIYPVQVKKRCITFLRKFPLISQCSSKQKSSIKNEPIV